MCLIQIDFDPWLKFVQALNYQIENGITWIYPPKTQDASGKGRFIEIPYYTCNDPGLPLLLAATPKVYLPAFYHKIKQHVVGLILWWWHNSICSSHSHWSVFPISRIVGKGWNLSSSWLVAYVGTSEVASRYCWKSFVVLSQNSIDSSGYNSINYDQQVQTLDITRFYYTPITPKMRWAGCIVSPFLAKSNDDIREKNCNTPILRASKSFPVGGYQVE